MDDVDTSRRKKPATPEGYESDVEFLSEMRENYDFAVDGDQHNRDAALQDIEFTYGDQWDSYVREQREKRRKPVITVNRLPAYMAQIINNRLLNETEIRVFPEREGTKEVAEIRQGLLRAIFKTPESDFARDESMKYQVLNGFGYFALATEYASDEVFDQNIIFKPIVDPLSVALDPMAVMPCGGDAQFGFITDDVPRKVFKKRYPWAAMSDFTTDIRPRTSEWYGEDCIRVAAYWRMVERGTKTIVLMADGQHKEVQPEAGVDVEAALKALTDAGMIAMRPDGTPYIKECPRRFAEMYLVSGADILEGPFVLPVSSLPIFRVAGWEVRNGNKVHRWGLIRFLKDPQRLHNYQRSLLAEQMVAAPRNKWLATKEAVSGYEKDWETSHLSDNPLLLFNAEGTVPTRVPAPQVDAALLNETQMTVQDIRDVSNIHEAALGIKSNEVSGKALQQRQQMTELSSFIYHDRLRLAELRAAQVCNELLPSTYDTTRMVTVLGEDDKVLQAVINDPKQPLTDISVGKYGVSVTTGPATITKRALAAESMTAFVNAAPETASLVMDLLAEAQDWPKADEFARRFREAKGIVDEENMTPDQQQAMMQAQEEQQMLKKLEFDKMQAEIREINATTAERLARARNLTLAGTKAVSDAAARAKDVDARVESQAFDRKMKVVDAATKIKEDDDAGTDD